MGTLTVTLIMVFPNITLNSRTRSHSVHKCIVLIVIDSSRSPPGWDTALLSPVSPVSALLQSSVCGE